MADDVVIRLSGDAGALIASLKQAADQFTMLRQTMAAGADAAKVFGQSFAQQAQAWLQSGNSADLFRAKLNALNEQMSLTREQQSLATQAIRDYTQQMSLTRESITTLSEAQKVMGDGFARSSQSFLAASTNAEDYSARLAMVREQIQLFQAQAAEVNAMTMPYGGAGLGGIFGEITGLGDAVGPLGALAGGLGDVVGGMGAFVSQSASFLGAMAGWTIIQDVTSWVQQLSSELFNLNVSTEKAYTGWKYLFGGGASGQSAATDMMKWTSQFSMNIPFTRQDLMGAVTTLSTTGLSPAAIEQFMPYLSDLAATYGSASYGGQGINLQGAANAIRMLSQGGQSRLLKYDLNINPQELLKYGLKGTVTSTGVHITDPNSVFVALENFAKAKGVAGASSGIVGSTWWGGYSSLVDNIQNLLLNMGGTNLDGTIRKGSFFASIKSDLDSLLKWFSDHQNQLQKFSDIASHLLGDVVNGGGGMLAQLAQWFDRLGGVQWIEQDITNLDTTVRQWFGMDAPTSVNINAKRGSGARTTQSPGELGGPPQWFTSMADAAQKIAGLNWSAFEAFMGQLVKDGPSMATTLDNMATDLQRMSTSMTPQEQKLLVDFFGAAGGALGIAATQTLHAMDAFSTGWAIAMKALDPLLSFGANNLKDMGIGLKTIEPLMSTISRYVLQAADPFQILANAVNDLNDALHTLNGSQLPSWLRNGVNWLANPLGPQPSSHSSSSHTPNATHTPGGYRAFGVTGA